MIKRAFLAALLSLTALPAAADETWTNPAGTLIYEQDLGMVAVISFPTNAGWSRLYPEFASERAQVYFPGLGGNFDDRSVHDGYWVVQGMPNCSLTVTSADGISTNRWGRAQIIFDRAAFPTGFTLLVGDCFDEPSRVIRADLTQ